ncbi:MAG: transporter [Thermoanaerobaculia bacterium]
MLLVPLVLASGAASQELDPRAYTPVPTGGNVLIAAYTYQTGDVLLDPSLPITDLSAKLSIATLGYARTFSFLGRYANASVGIPGAHLFAEGNVFEERQTRTRTGLGDARAKLAVNLLGAHALAPPEFARTRPATVLGVSLTVSAPTGQYSSDRLVNLGANRWAFKPELGFSHPVGRWLLDAYAGVWLFAANHEFYGGVTRTQDPLFTFQAHVSYTVRPSLWIAGDATFYSGGRTTVGDTVKQDFQKNSRVGLTASYPVARGHSVKLSFATGASTRIGQDFNTIGLAWQYMWLDGPKSPAGGASK